MSAIVLRLAVMSSPTRAVAARRALHEHALLVAQRGRKPVDLRLGREGDVEFLVALEEAPRALDEVDDVLVGVGLGEAEHGHRMAHLGKAFGRRSTDPLRRRILAHEVGKALLDGEVAPRQRIIVGVRDRRRVLGVIAPVMAGDFFGQAREFLRPPRLRSGLRRACRTAGMLAFRWLWRRYAAMSDRRKLPAKSKPSGQLLN